MRFRRPIERTSETLGETVFAIVKHAPLLGVCRELLAIEFIALQSDVVQSTGKEDFDAAFFAVTQCAAAQMPRECLVILDRNCKAVFEQ